MTRAHIDYSQRAQNSVKGTPVSGVVCPACGSDSHHRVTDSRPLFTQIGKVVRRRRKCTGCGEKFTTVELSSDEFNALMDERERVRQVVSGLIEAYSNFRGET